MIPERHRSSLTRKVSEIYLTAPTNQPYAVLVRYTRASIYSSRYRSVCWQCFAGTEGRGKMYRMMLTYQGARAGAQATATPGSKQSWMQVRQLQAQQQCTPLCCAAVTAMNSPA
jgi:hypothetical protein